MFKIIVAVGLRSGKEYARGHTEANLHRYLNKKYKYQPVNKNIKEHFPRIYDEPLKIERR